MQEITERGFITFTPVSKYCWNRQVEELTLVETYGHNLRTEEREQEAYMGWAFHFVLSGYFYK
jgi:hypothetical protein